MENNLNNEIMNNPNVNCNSYCRSCGAPLYNNAVVCTKCGVAKGTGNNFCCNCGKPTNPAAVVCTSCGASLESKNANADGISPKSRLIALLLAIFTGAIGIHKFYLGKIGLGVLYIFTLGLFGIGSLIDIIMIAVGSAKDGNGLTVKNWNTD